MRSFDYSDLYTYSWDNEILSYVAKIHEYKGRQELYLKQRPMDLKRLVEIARIQSTESSNEIEGIQTTSTRMRQLLNDKTTPRNRAEKEILGYRNVLNTIHENYEYIPIKPEYIQQLHRDLMIHAGTGYGGEYKRVQNEIDRIDADGQRIKLFEPLSPIETPTAIEKICESYRNEIAKGQIDPLLLIPCFILDFLCIHPFTDGNGRMSRLLTLLLLYQSGYLVGRYISIEKMIADTKEYYYQSLRESDRHWHDGENDLRPFIKYMLAMILSCYRVFEERVHMDQPLSAYETVFRYVTNHIGKFTKQDVLINCPTIGSSSAEASLKKLGEERIIKKLGSGKNTFYVRMDAIQ